MSSQKQDRKQKAARLFSLIIAGVMLLSVVAAAVLSQVW